MSIAIAKRVVGFVLLAVAVPLMAYAAGDFPGRALFVRSHPIEIEDLHARLGQVQIVDVRSKYEYDTLHIKDAAHLDLHDDAFRTKVAQLRKSSGKPLVFYCNGRSCYKSYEADEQAQGAGVDDSLVFDAGVLEWAKKYPDQAVLLGKSPADPSRLISEEDFKKHLLAPADFIAKAPDRARVLDVRDPLQRQGIGIFIEDTNISLDKTEALKQFVKAVQSKGEPLFAYDMAGKQVQWFQYFLEDVGVKNYYFMRGGVKAYFAEVIHRK